MTTWLLRKHFSRGWFFTAALTFGLLNAAGAQVRVDPDNTADSTVIYPAAFFTQYSPVSVNDMIDRIPGVSISGGGGGRGLGSGGNLLINGQRLAGKTNSPRDQLGRITARQVERIEIIRSNSPELDIRNSGQIVNVVLKDVDNRSSVSAEINMDRHRDGTLDPGASLSYSGRRNDFSYLFNVMADPSYNHDQRDETGYYPDGRLKDTTRESNIRDKTDYQATMNLGYRFGSDRVQFNTRISQSEHPSEINRAVTSFAGALPAVRNEREQIDYDNLNWEIGGDYERVFADNSRWTTLLLVNDQINDNIRERFRVLDSGSEKTLYLESNRRTRERIAKTSYSWTLADNQDMQLGLERAQTILDSSLFLGAATNTGITSPLYGNLTPLPGSSNPGSTVQEMRYEGSASHNWTMNERMSLESSLVYEMSEIEQSGTVNKSRDFAFLRPKLDYRFNINPALQMRASVERHVSQLSFSQFTASANNSDTDKSINVGNPDLVQEKELRYEMNLEYRLPEDAGVLSSRFFYREVSDVIGRVIISDNPAAPLSAPGNIGDGVRYGVHLDASTRLGFLGMPDAILRTGVNLFDSRVTDPFLGKDVRMSGSGRASIGFRHDLPALNLNYGFNYSSNFNGGQKVIDIDMIEEYSSEPQLSLFVSKVAFDNITFRLESMNTLNNRSCRERLRYTGTPLTGTINEIENSCNGSGQKLALKVRTTF
jgi:outer membrane receptor for ferrienterochelin and colicin